MQVSASLVLTAQSPGCGRGHVAERGQVLQGAGKRRKSWPAGLEGGAGRLHQLLRPAAFVPTPQRAQTVSSVPWFRLSPLLAGCERVQAPAAHSARMDVGSAPSLVRGARCGNRRAFCRAAQRGCSALTYSVAGVAEARTS